MMKKIYLGKRLRAQQGFSLIELMIAMVLGLLLIAGVLNIFLGSSQTYRLQEAMFRVQESGRFALDIVQRDLRSAGFQNVLIDDKDFSYTAAQGIPVATAAALAEVDNGVVSETLKISSTGSDTYYYVAPDVGGQLALFQNASAIVEGIENVAFLYGVDTSGNSQADSFVARAAVGTRWGDVVAVRVSFLVASNDAGVVETAQAPPTPFASIPSDRRMYQAFTSTVALRNKMP
jgi:type IV pilus assembly protein PilW